MNEELELVETDINEVGHMMTVKQSDFVASRSKETGTFALWIKTDVGMVKVKRVFVMLADDKTRNETLS